MFVQMLTFAWAYPNAEKLETSVKIANFSHFPQTLKNSVSLTHIPTGENKITNYPGIACHTNVLKDGVADDSDPLTHLCAQLSHSTQKFVLMQLSKSTNPSVARTAVGLSTL